MPGVVGGRAVDAPADRLTEPADPGRTDRWTFEHGEYSLALGYHTDDPQGHAIWEDGDRAGVVYGALTTRAELGWSTEELFDRLLDRPAETAAALEGGFVIACQDAAADRQLLVTDKLGARPLFYTAEGPLRFGSAVSQLVPFCDDPTVNLQGVSDMLLMGNLWSQHTLVEDVLAQRPATVLDIVDGERSTTRYWKPEYTEADPNRAYLTKLTDRYRQAVRRTSTTLPEEAGIWLSGGLDSRTTTGALHQYRRPCGPETLRTFTYDANPPTGDNIRIAGQVTETLGIPNEQVPLTAETVGEGLEQIIETTDGNLMWVYGANLSATSEMQSPPPVLMEGMQGALLGDHLYRHHLHDAATAVDSQLASEAITDPSGVRSLLSASVDPLGSFKTEASRAEGSTTRERVLDVHFQNYYSRVFMPGNRLMRDRVGTRVAQADGDYLELCAKLPRQLRKGSFRGPLTPDGGVPYEPTRAKLSVIRRIDPDLADIPYERSKVKPSRPYPLHVAGFVGNVVTNRLLRKPTYGSGQLADFWIRDTETRLHDRVTELIDDACDRPLFDADAVRAVYDQHMTGEHNASRLGQITTIEHWLQTNLD